MAIDQRDVSSKLRFMDDRALQQYAAMHKSDPYIFPLAFQESQNRQRLRMSQQAQAGAQPQPKVNEQALAQMAPPQAQPMPETQGIATLPAQNMQQMADGGIAGYEGYDEGSNDFGQEPVLRMAEGGVARYQVGGAATAELANLRAARERYIQAGADTSGIDQAIAFLEEKPGRAAAQRAAADSAPPAQMSGFAEQMMQGTDTTPAAAAAPTDYDPTKNLKKLAKTDKYISTSTPNNPEEARLLNRYPTTKPAAKKADTGRPAPTRAATDPSAKTETGGLDKLMAEFTRQQDLAKGASKNADVQYASTLRGEAAKLVTDEENRIKDQVDPYKDREARLLKQEKGLEGMGDKYLGLALLQAGAAMMTTPGNIGMALGKGVQVGSERYIQGMEKINAAKDKFADARDRLDDLRLNRADMNARDIKAAKTEARTLERQAEALFYTGAKEDLKMTNQGITDLFKVAAENISTDKKIQSAEKIAAIGESGANARSAAQIAATLSAPDKVLFAQALKKNDNDAFKAWAEVQQAQGDKFNLRTSYADYLKAFAGKDGLTPPMSIGAYAGLVGATLPR
jgi:hypothetical protein